MELNKEQIQQIDAYLKAIDFDYQDLKPEILDHMATEIEEIMQKRNLDFNDAFVLTKIKWNKNFRKISSFYFGNSIYAPKIVIEKAKRFYKNFYFGYLFFYFFPFIVLKKIDINYTSSLKIVLQILAYSTTILLLFILYKMQKKQD